MQGRQSKLAVLLLGLGVFAAACGGGQQGGGGQEGEAAAGGEFSVYLSEPQNPLIPTATDESEGHQVLYSLFTGLFDYDPETSEPVPAMAQSVSSEDNRTWTITIKAGWTFHDRTPVTAQSFVDGWNYGAYGPNAQDTSYFFENIEGYADLQCGKNAEGKADCAASPPKASQMSGLKVINDTTFEVTLMAPFSQFPLTLGYTPYYPVPKALLEDPQAFGDAPIGNGPFMMDGTWEHNRQIRLKRFDDYGGEPAKAEALEYRIYSEVETGYNDLLANNLDVIDQIPPQNITTTQQDLGERFIDRPRSDITLLEIPLYRPEFKDPRIRRAISMAIDREAITRAVFNGTRQPAASYVSPVVVGFREDPCGVPCQFNPQEAKRLFDEVGGLPRRLTLWFNSGAGHETWMEALANQLAQNLGIEPPVFQAYDFGEYLGFVERKEVTGPFRLGWIMDYPSPQNYLQPLFSTTGSSNDIGYSNPRVDELIAKGNAALTVEDGVESYHQAEDLVLQDMPMIPLWFGRVQAAYSENVRNVVVDAFGRVDTANVEVVSQ